MIKTILNPECGKRLKECLADSQMTQGEMSSLTGYTQQYISNIVVGKKPLTIKAAKLFSDVLNVREEYLLCIDTFKTESDIIRYENNSSCLNFQRISQYLETLNIKITPLVPIPALKAKEEDMKSCDIRGELFKNEKKYFLCYFPYLKEYTPKDSNTAMFKMLKGSLFYEVKTPNSHEIITHYEFGKLMDEIDSFITFSIQNFLTHHLFPLDDDTEIKIKK